MVKLFKDQQGKEKNIKGRIDDKKVKLINIKISQKFKKLKRLKNDPSIVTTKERMEGNVINKVSYNKLSLTSLNKFTQTI